MPDYNVMLFGGPYDGATTSIAVEEHSEIIIVDDQIYQWDGIERPEPEPMHFVWRPNFVTEQ